MKLSIFISDENSQSSPKSEGTDTEGEHFVHPSPDSGVPWSTIKILNLVALIQEIKSFGYTSNDDVKERYHSCMMKGKYEKICDLICKKVSALSASDPGDDSANKCYQCRGKQGYTHRQGPTWHMVEPKIYFRWTGQAGRVLFTKIIFKWVFLELKK